jgi:hypothetical protein
MNIEHEHEHEHQKTETNLDFCFLKNHRDLKCNAANENAKQELAANRIEWIIAVMMA